MLRYASKECGLNERYQRSPALTTNTPCVREGTSMAAPQSTSIPARDKLPTPSWRRFLAKIQFCDGDGCWEWIGSRSSTGYGNIRCPTASRVMVRNAHRLSYEFFVGPIPPGLFVCHKCDNRGCVNPDHLFVGTCADNSADMVAKGRSVHGERNRKARLTAKQIAEIRRLYAAGGITQEQIGEMYGVSGSHICGIVKGKFWKAALQTLRS